MVAYYNEIDKHHAKWLERLIAAGEIAPGHVDTRSIKDVTASDLSGYAQVHLFAGIGGWSLAARIAGWPDNKPLWSGSCPCQPFSRSGKRKGNSDERHLWPKFQTLISQCGPSYVVGEQVAGDEGYKWLDGVWSDLEADNYTVGAAVIPAASVGAPHRRDRIYFLAHAESVRRSGKVLPAERWLPPHRTTQNSWGDFTPIGARARRIKPGIDLLADGLSPTMGRLRAYGNAIVPQIGAIVLGVLAQATHHKGSSDGQ